MFLSNNLIKSHRQVQYNRLKLVGGILCFVVESDNLMQLHFYELFELYICIECICVNVLKWK